ncbi:4330_t:CDS:1, partial [Ambispora leptoticha]
ISSWTHIDILPVFLLLVTETYTIEEIEMVKRGITDLIQHLLINEPINIEEYIDIDRNEEIYFSTDKNILFQKIVDMINRINTLEEEESSEK